MQAHAARAFVGYFMIFGARGAHVRRTEGWSAGSTAWLEELDVPRCPPVEGGNTKGYSSTYLAMGFANVRAGTRYPPEH